MISIEHPYDDLTGGKWLRGNLHSHTTNSDGERSLQDVVDTYATFGHGFLMISDHDILTTTADFTKVNPRGLILIPGNEITNDGPHLLHVGANATVHPDQNRQLVVDKIAETGGFAIFNHPNWFARFDHCSQEVLENTTGYTGIEIYNGVISRLQGSPYATDRWDMLLSKGRRLWGFANDDSHKAVGDDKLGWNVAYVKDNTASGVVEALRNGRFYASTGVVIDDIVVDKTCITIKAPNAGRIVGIKDDAVRFAHIDGGELTVEVPTGASYVRFECWGSGESFAWTQPFFIG